MRLIPTASEAEFDRRAADILCRHALEHPGTLLALPTGRTPLGLYRALRVRTATELAALRAARYVNLDEYQGLAATDPRSYAAFLEQQVFGPLAIAASQVRLVRGDAPDSDAECESVEAYIGKSGGIGLAVLGLGANGHIAFNEPGTPWSTRSHVAQLTPQTLTVNQRVSGSGDLPARGLTLGIATLCAARSVLLLAAGEAKRNALARLLAGIPSLEWPATSLIGHPGLTVVCAPELRDLAVPARHPTGATARPVRPGSP